MTAYTANLTLPYPEVSDPPAGSSQLQSLAEAVDAMATPVLHKVTWKTGYNDRNDSGYYLAWGRVWWQGGCTNSAGALETGTALMTVPEEARPVENNEYFAIPVGGGRTGYATFYPNGEMRITVATAVWKPSTWLSLDGVSYPVK